MRDGQIEETPQTEDINVHFKVMGRAYKVMEGMSYKIVDKIFIYSPEA